MVETARHIHPPDVGDTIIPKPGKLWGLSTVPTVPHTVKKVDDYRFSEAGPIADVVMIVEETRAYNQAVADGDNTGPDYGIHIGMDEIELPVRQIHPVKQAHPTNSPGKQLDKYAASEVEQSWRQFPARRDLAPAAFDALRKVLDECDRAWTGTPSKHRQAVRSVISEICGAVSRALPAQPTSP
jgi:hypothetical protein